MIGFRSKKPWKMTVAIIYYSLCFLGFEAGVKIGVAGLLVMGTLPVLLLSVADAVRTKDKSLLYTIPMWITAVAVAFVLCAMWSAEQTEEAEKIKTVATEKPVATEEIMQAPKQSDEFVFITRSGSKYHKEDCKFIKNKETISISVKEAESSGKGPCSYCYN